MNSLKLNYISFFVVYFIISLINTLVILYIPVFMLIVLDVNRVELAFIQFLSYLTLFLGPLSALFFDKFGQKKRILISTSSAVLFVSFFFFVLNAENLSYFGLFLSLNFTSSLLIKAGMSKLMLEISDQKHIQKNVVLISNISGSLGSIFPIMLFNVLMYDINSVGLWSLFFNLCWIASFPILISFALIRDKEFTTGLEVKTTLKNQIDDDHKKIGQLGLMLTFCANFLIWGDKLIEYPFTYWIITKYGESGFFVYSYLFFIFTYLYMSGWFISRRLINHYKTRLYLSISIILYGSLMISLIFSNLPMFLLTTAVNRIVSGVMMSQLTERNINVSKLNKNKALSYEIIRTSSLLASFIFVPLGTLLNSFVPTEILIIIVGFMALSSLWPIYSYKYNW
ncbi:MAG: hypothetical protein ACFE96_00865 [Candidatus Hermodarchaeota archaeon]